MENIIELLKMNPTLAMILGFLLACFLAFLFRDTIALYIKKKYNLLDSNEVSKIVEDTIKESTRLLNSEKVDI